MDVVARAPNSIFYDYSLIGIIAIHITLLVVVVMINLVKTMSVIFHRSSGAKFATILLKR